MNNLLLKTTWWSEREREWCYFYGQSVESRDVLWKCLKHSSREGGEANCMPGPPHMRAAMLALLPPLEADVWRPLSRCALSVPWSLEPGAHPMARNESSWRDRSVWGESRREYSARERRSVLIMNGSSILDLFRRKSCGRSYSQPKATRKDKYTNFKKNIKIKNGRLSLTLTVKLG